MGQKIAVLIALALVLSLPFIVRATGGGDASPKSGGGSTAVAAKLVIVTPHVEQIRYEFGRAFDRWHVRTRGSHVEVDWRAPGGTADIMKQLEATFEAAAKNGLIDAKGVAKPGSAGFDLFFGGGSYEHGKMKKERRAMDASGKALAYRMGRPAGFEQKRLDEWYGVNKIGTQNLYDPEQFWMGTALSGFGIVYNRDVLAKLGLPEPRSFADLCDFRMFNMVALADGRQSGSVTTTYDSILNKEGWEKGWRTLREMCGNARYFASSSTKPPIDVSQGEAAAGMAIDFYGRSQAQMLAKPGMDPKSVRVGYVDPEGAVYIDADPVSILNGASDFDLARSFVEFCLTEEAQALWQFPALGATADLKPEARFERGVAGIPASGAIPEDMPADSEVGGGRLFGPFQYELRRMPVRRVMYEKYGQWFIDKSDPFKAASDVPQRRWRSAIAPMMAAFGIDTVPELREAWSALNAARAASKEGRFPTETLQEMERLFYAMPMHTMRDGTTLELNEKNFKTIEADTNSWNDLDHGKRALIAYTRFFRENYRRVTATGRENGL